jgi:hypothetical protein
MGVGPAGWVGVGEGPGEVVSEASTSGKNTSVSVAVARSLRFVAEGTGPVSVGDAVGVGWVGRTLRRVAVGAGPVSVGATVTASSVDTPCVTQGSVFASANSLAPARQAVGLGVGSTGPTEEQLAISTNAETPDITPQRYIVLALFGSP